jgi:Flp pilus assembly protein TadG
MNPRHPRFATCRRAVAALEFGLLAPVMAIIVVGVLDIAKVAILWEQVWSAAQSIGESATTLAIPSQPGTTNQLTLAQANEAMSLVFAEVPWVAAGIAAGTYTGNGQNPPNTVTVVLSSVDYAPVQAGCTTNCQYESMVKWSKAYTGTATTTGFNYTNVTRPCGEAWQPSAFLANLNYQSNGIYVPDPFLVVDVSIKFSPAVFAFLTGSFTLSATSYVPVRISQAQPTTPNDLDDFIQLIDPNDPVPGSVCLVSPGT